MDKKVCSKCNQTLPIDNFYFKNKSKGCRRPSCKECIKKYHKANKERKNAYDKGYREVNKEKLAEQKKAYYEANKKRFAERAKTYREANKEKIAELKKAYYEANKEQRKAYYEANKEKIAELRKAYYEANKEKIAEQKKTYRQANKEKITERERRKRKEDPFYRLKLNYRGSCRRAFKSISQKKNNSSLKLLGLKTWQELSDHLSKQFYNHPETGEQMTLDNHGFHGWHIDHIIPLDSAKTEEEIIKLCHYTNLQPLWAEENLAKSNKILDTQ